MGARRLRLRRDDGEMRRLAPIEQAQALGLRLDLRRLDVPAGERRPFAAPDCGEQLLYVISGTGSVIANDGEQPLSPETIVWLEAGERCMLAAGGGGLAVLAAAGRVPAAA